MVFSINYFLQNVRYGTGEEGIRTSPTRRAAHLGPLTQHGGMHAACRAVLVACRVTPLRHRCSSAAVSGQPISESDFTSLASEAIRTGSVLDLSQRSVELKAPFKLGSDDVLRITGGTIFGSPHTLFQVQTSPKGLLELRGCELRHLPSAERTEKKTLGAALFARGKGRVALHDCTLASQAGFGVWLVQRAQAELHGCTVPRCGRSSVVAFEKARLDVRGSLLSDGSPRATNPRPHPSPSRLALPPNPRAPSPSPEP